MYTGAMTTNKAKKVSEQTRAVQNLRGSGAAGTHADRRTKRKRTRAAQESAAKEEFE